MKQEARRTMSEALRTVELPAAAIAVIKEGALKPRAGTNALPSDNQSVGSRSGCRWARRVGASAGVANEGHCGRASSPWWGIAV